MRTKHFGIWMKVLYYEHDIVMIIIKLHYAHYHYYYHCLHAGVICMLHDYIHLWFINIRDIVKHFHLLFPIIIYRLVLL